MHHATSPAAGSAAFDFFIGDWRVRHRRLRQRLAECDEWQSFGGRTSTRKILGGLGNIDENVLDLPAGGYEAVSLRLFQPAHHRWSIWWIDARDPALATPVHGRFENGVGTFYGDDVIDDKAIRVRFLWSAITAGSAQWEQAFSVDGGAAWETNWFMNFERIA
jgi:hypothetical protein